MYFLCDCGAADDMTPLEYQGLEAGLGKISAAGEPVMAANDNDGIIGLLCLLVMTPFDSRKGDSGWPEPVGCRHK